MATAIAGGGSAEELDALMDEARAVGEMSSRLALTSIRLRLEQRQFAAARRVLEAAKTDGVADVACYVTTITACHRAGRHREAKRVVASAIGDVRLASEDLRRIRAAHGRARRAVPQVLGRREVAVERAARGGPRDRQQRGGREQARGGPRVPARGAAHEGDLSRAPCGLALRHGRVS